MLADGMAEVAMNCRLKNGKLVPLHRPSFLDQNEGTLYLENNISRIREASSLYCWKHTLRDGTVRADFLAFPGLVYFTHGNIADDVYDRIFVTGETGVSFVDQYGSETRNAPCVYLFDRNTEKIIRHPILKDTINAPKVRLEGEPKEDESKEYAYFYLSWVDEYGYESAASFPSKNWDGEAFTDEPLQCNATSTVRFEPVVIPIGAHGVRVYKSNPGDETATTQFIKEYSRNELPSLAQGFSLEFNDATAAETMPELESPPGDLCDMTFVAGNYYVGRSPSMPHTVLFSDVDLPTSWPTAYRYDIRDNLVRVAVTANSVFALTDGFPYVLSGTDPSSMTATVLAGPAACVSERSVVVYRNAVYFASNYGLYAIFDSADSGTVCQCITEKLFTKEQWQALNPSSCLMAQYDNALHMFFHAPNGGTYPDTGKRGKAFILDFTEQANILTEHEEMATCLATDNRTDELYYVREV